MFGQEAPPIAEISLSSLAAIGLVGFARPGNLWLWIPQARLGVASTSPIKLGLEGAILAPVAGEPQGPFFTRPDRAERSGRPNLELRFRARWEKSHTTGEVSLGGHLGWLARASDDLVPSRTAVLSTQLTATDYLEFRGELLAGQALAGLGGGGLARTSGPAASPSALAGDGSSSICTPPPRSKRAPVSPIIGMRATADMPQPSAGGFQPAYRSLARVELARRAARGLQSLEACRACPRNCGINRLQNKWAACKTGRYATVASYFPHFGEEDCLRGTSGSGTIFFAHRNLRCVFCQNYDISQAIKPAQAQGHRPQEIAGMMFELQSLGCHNINLVTPEHAVPQILEALVIAVEEGLNLPIVYNTSAYDSLESLALMDGIVDIYMPDFKYWSVERSRRYLKAQNYPEAARAAIKEMHRQVGPLVLDRHGLARRGVLLRHLVMPGALEETRAILEWAAKELGPDTYVNLMDQYRPAGRVTSATYPEINRRIGAAEFAEAVRLAFDLGLRRLDQRSLGPG